jgi:hemoglobin
MGEDELGARFVECFVRAADDAGLPDDAEFRGELGAYMEWAVEDVLSHSPRGSAVPPGRAIPRWSWGGLEPTPASC